MAEKTSIMPITVPSRPSKGDDTGNRAQGIQKALELVHHVAATVFDGFLDDFPRAVPVRQRGGLEPAQRRTTAQLPDVTPIQFMPRSPVLDRGAQSLGITLFRRRVQKRSMMMATASVEQSRMGAINQPPAIMISSTIYTPYKSCWENDTL